ncbi:MAG: class I adenylate-forming enzyme family protein, partial [Rhodospirillales bacterium]
MPSPPSTLDYLCFHAARQPEHIALHFNGQPVSYARFHEDTARMVALLRRTGIRPGEHVAVEMSNFYLHWMILLAIEALGAASFSFPPEETTLVSATLKLMDRVISNPEHRPEGLVETRLISLNEVMTFPKTQPETPIRQSDFDDRSAFRIVRSSGTTGEPKTMIQSRGAFETRLAQAQAHLGFTPRTRYLMAFGFPVQAYHLHGTACLRAGATCLFDRKIRIDEALTVQQVTDILLLPRTLVLMLNNLDETYRPLPGRRIFVIGGSLSASLRRRAADSFGAEIIESYGSNETGAAARVSPDGRATVLPGVDIQVVDDHDSPITGAPGRIRIRTGGAVNGYLNDPERTALQFRDGWFYPGDVGLVVSPRVVRIVGREDDLLNIQGRKYDSRDFEEQMLRNWPVRDACLIHVDDGGEMPTLWAVIVPQDPGKGMTILTALEKRVTPAFGKTRLVTLPEIPRTLTG